MRGNPDNLRRAAAAKKAATTQRAEQGLRDMIRRGDTITVRALAQTAGVSLDFLYRNTDLRRRVEQLRDQQRTNPPPAPAQPDPDQPSSSVRTLTNQLILLKRRHRDETTALKQALEAVHGENLELRRRVGHRALTEPAQATHQGTQADASMDVLNAMAEIHKATSRALVLLHKQQINFTADRAQAIAGLCDGAEARIAAVRDLITGSTLDDATLATFLDDNENLL